MKRINDTARLWTAWRRTLGDFEGGFDLDRDAAEVTPDPPARLGSAAATRFVLAAAAITGFAFTLMELVWYRMLSPLLGGSTYTFGLILAVALLGIGAGSLARSIRSRPRSFVMISPESTTTP